MHKFLLVLAVFVASACVFSPAAIAKETSVSDKLKVSPLSESVYLHTSDNNNGVVVFSGGQALAISTPATDAETQALIHWITRDMKAKLVGFVADRWHPDAMGGLNTVRSNGIRTYAHHLTRKIARQRGLPVPEIGFQNHLEIDVGDRTVFLDFLGAAHTGDGIVAWIPEDQILFGGNGVRDAGGWIGNIGDADLTEWSRTMSRVQERYRAAEIVVPGHGKVGGVELLSSTQAMYEAFARPIVEREPSTMPCPSDENLLVERAEIDTTDGSIRTLEGAAIVVQDAYKAVRVSSPVARIDVSDGRVTAPEGQVEIYDKVDGLCELRSALTFERLFLVNVDEFVGLAVVLKAAEPIG